MRNNTTLDRVTEFVVGAQTVTKTFTVDRSLEVSSVIVLACSVTMAACVATGMTFSSPEIMSMIDERVNAKRINLIPALPAIPPPLPVASVPAPASPVPVTPPPARTPVPKSRAREAHTGQTSGDRGKSNQRARDKRDKDQDTRFKNQLTR